MGSENRINIQGHLLLGALESVGKPSDPAYSPKEVKSCTIDTSEIDNNRILITCEDKDKNQYIQYALSSAEQSSFTYQGRNVNLLNAAKGFSQTMQTALKNFWGPERSLWGNLSAYTCAWVGEYWSPTGYDFRNMKNLIDSDHKNGLCGDRTCAEAAQAILKKP